MTRKTHHVVPNSKHGGWYLKEGGSRDYKLYKTKEEAIVEGRKISRNQKTELVIHNQEGKIVESDSHGRDPFPPRG